MVTAGSSAESAGIKMGDRVLDIEGMPAASVSARIASEMLRGPLGSAVTLSVTKGEHAGKSTATEGATPKAAEVVVLDRRRLSQPAVRSVAVDVPSGGWVSYVRMHYFSQSLAGKLRAAVAEAEASERPPVGYVIDVRNNPGGDFEEAVVASSMFLDCDGAGQCDVVKTGEWGGPRERGGAPL